MSRLVELGAVKAALNGERVDAEDTKADGDHAYNLAIDHCLAALDALPATAGGVDHDDDCAMGLGGHCSCHASDERGEKATAAAGVCPTCRRSRSRGTLRMYTGEPGLVCPDPFHNITEPTVPVRGGACTRDPGDLAGLPADKTPGSQSGAASSQCSYCGRPYVLAPAPSTCPTCNHLCHHSKAQGKCWAHHLDGYCACPTCACPECAAPSQPSWGRAEFEQAVRASGDKWTNFNRVVRDGISTYTNELTNKLYEGWRLALSRAPGGVATDYDYEAAAKETQRVACEYGEFAVANWDRMSPRWQTKWTNWGKAIIAKALGAEKGT